MKPSSAVVRKQDQRRRRDRVAREVGGAELDLSHGGGREQRQRRHRPDRERINHRAGSRRGRGLQVEPVRTGNRVHRRGGRRPRCEHHRRGEKRQYDEQPPSSSDPATRGRCRTPSPRPPYRRRKHPTSGVCTLAGGDAGRHETPPTGRAPKGTAPGRGDRGVPSTAPHAAIPVPPHRPGLALKRETTVPTIQIRDIPTTHTRWSAHTPARPADPFGRTCGTWSSNSPRRHVTGCGRVGRRARRTRAGPPGTPTPAAVARRRERAGPPPVRRADRRCRARET